jgi:hypothetical protein
MAKIQMQSKTKTILSIRICYFNFVILKLLEFFFQNLAKLVELVQWKN